MHLIKMTQEFGRGMYASHLLEAGDIVTTCEVLVLSSEDTLKVNQTELKHYTFVYDESRDCLVLGDGEIFNHSDNPNVAYHLDDFDGRKVMRFVALRIIETGQQMFTDYNQDVKVNIEDYKNQKSLI
jgi:hypothetical protein